MSSQASSPTSDHLTMGSGKLSQLLNSSGVDFGTTPQGRSWCLRALHPSDDGVPVAGIPDRTSMPTGMLHFKTTGVVTNTAGSYDVDLVFLPSPLLFGTASVFTAGTTTALSRLDILNSQLGGSTLSTLVNAWRLSVSAARIAYYGITVYYDSPTLYDQGGVVVAQQPASFAIKTTVDPATATYTGGPVRFEYLMGLPMAVQHAARLGVYCPIRLSQPALNFVDQQQQLAYLGWFPPVTGAPTSYTMSHLMDAQMAGISFRNVSNQTSIRIVVRMGVEFTPVSASPYMPFTHPSPAVDERALNSYFTASGRLPDGWPSDYNDLGKLVAVLRGLAKTVWPVVKIVGGSVPGGTAVLEGLEMAAKRLTAATNRMNSAPRRKPGKTPAGAKSKSKNKKK